MRLDPYDLKVNRSSTKSFLFLSHKCTSCRQVLWLERVYIVKDQDKDILAWFCAGCCESRQDAYEKVFIHEMDAYKAARDNEIRRLSGETTTLSNKLEALTEGLDELIKIAMDVPDGEMTPFVHQAVVSIENIRKKAV